MTTMMSADPETFDGMLNSCCYLADQGDEEDMLYPKNKIMHAFHDAKSSSFVRPWNLDRNGRPSCVRLVCDDEDLPVLVWASMFSDEAKAGGYVHDYVAAAVA